MAVHSRRISNEVYERVGSYLCNFGEGKYQVPKSECERLATVYSGELGREIHPEEVQFAAKKFKLANCVPLVRGAKFRVQLVNGELVSRELSRSYRAKLQRQSGNGNGNNGERTEENHNTTEETQTFNIPPHLQPFENAIRKQVKLQTYNLRRELVESKQELKQIKCELSEVKGKLKEAIADCHAEADRYKSLVITYDNKMVEMRHMQKIIEAVDEYTAYKRSTMKRKTDAII